MTSPTPRRKAGIPALTIVLALPLAAPAAAADLNTINSSEAYIILPVPLDEQIAPGPFHDPMLPPEGPLTAYLPILDFDRDLLEDADDNCMYVFNPGQEDFDGDGVGDACDVKNDSP